MNALRVLEFVGNETVAAEGATWADAFPTNGRLAVKLASDTVRFLVRACHLPSEFLQRFDELTKGKGQPDGSDVADDNGDDDASRSSVEQGELFDKTEVTR